MGDRRTASMRTHAVIVGVPSDDFVEARQNEAYTVICICSSPILTIEAQNAREARIVSSID